jgi:hypothetical protein
MYTGETIYIKRLMRSYTANIRDSNLFHTYTILLVEMRGPIMEGKESISVKITFNRMIIGVNQLYLDRGPMPGSLAVNQSDEACPRAA